MSVMEQLLAKMEESGKDGNVFQVHAKATENAWSPSVNQQVDVMTRVGTAADQRFLHFDMLEVLQ